jgi:glucose-1-phosphate adenylyltransferase
LNDFIRFARDKHPYNSICLNEHTTNYLDLTQFGIAQINKADQLIDFEEKPYTPRSNLIATCIYHFSKERLPLIPRYLELGNQKDTPGSFISWLVENDIVYGKKFTEAWFDLGDFDSLSEAVIQLNGKNK